MPAITTRPVPARRLFDQDYHYFFGYFDKSPWDATGTMILAHRAAFAGRMPTADDPVTIGYRHVAEGAPFVPLDESYAWNWQQGAMLQWLPGRSPHIVYNNRCNGAYVAIIRDASTGEVVRVLPRPVYALSPDGRFALSLDFTRLQATRPDYGYPLLPGSAAPEPCPSDDGVYLLDLHTCESRLLISFRQIAELGNYHLRGDILHWFGHFLFAPGGQRFCFVHRMRAQGSGGFFSRLFTADLAGQHIFCLLDSGKVSHYDWPSDTHLLVWARKPQAGGTVYQPQPAQPAAAAAPAHPLKLAARSIYRSLPALGWLRQQYQFWQDQHRHGLGYLLLTDQSNHYQHIAPGVLVEDGHCAFAPDRAWFVTDTYPDHRRQRHLMLYHMASARLIHLGAFYSPREALASVRCDLHPRWNNDGSQVCIDSFHEQGRNMYVLDVAPVPGRDG